MAATFLVKQAANISAERLVTGGGEEEECFESVSSTADLAG